MIYNLTEDWLTSQHALIVLHQPINEAAFEASAANACIIVCADGGANRLFDLQHQHQHQHLDKHKHKQPDAIVGDLDSLNSNVEAYYRALNVNVVHDPDQYSTDFMKSLRYIRSLENFRNNRLDVVVLGGIGGRVDQGLSQLHHLFKAAEDPSLLNGQIFLLSEQSLSFPLQPGSHEIICRRQIEREEEKATYFTENTGIIPLLGKAVISLRGFEWDVEEWSTRMGGQLSTSNHVKADKVGVSCNRPVLFTIELAEWFRREG